jgi:hypothetical protein
MKATITQNRAPGFSSRMSYLVHFADGSVVKCYTLARAKKLAGQI